MFKTKRLRTPKIVNPQYSFYKGWLQVKIGDAEAVRSKLMEVFHTENTNVFYHRIKGRTELRYSHVLAVEKVFNQYGITDIWGEVEND